ncbi:hypothetical protein NDU88_000469 [Pleurodeles waltl]|uniref:Uncharacterized protein n=1 Tax=Pleurodeles waltl TaxID=8319 RepID=A0AAV7S9L7_PLEWA|nr:hypothetical protein NDU88_000469 [Pleurodeles waltl]
MNCDKPKGFRCEQLEVCERGRTVLRHTPREAGSVCDHLPQVKGQWAAALACPGQAAGRTPEELVVDWSVRAKRVLPARPLIAPTVEATNLQVRRKRRGDAKESGSPGASALLGSQFKEGSAEVRGSHWSLHTPGLGTEGTDRLTPGADLTSLTAAAPRCHQTHRAERAGAEDEHSPGTGRGESNSDPQLLSC